MKYSLLREEEEEGQKEEKESCTPEHSHFLSLLPKALYSSCFFLTELRKEGHEGIRTTFTSMTVIELRFSPVKVRVLTLTEL